MVYLFFRRPIMDLPGTTRAALVEAAAENNTLAGLIAATRKAIIDRVRMGAPPSQAALKAGRV